MRSENQGRSMADDIEKFGTANDTVASPVSKIAAPLAKSKSDDRIVAEPAFLAPVNKITWPQVGLVNEPGRHRLEFGWLILTIEDLVVWQAFPNAAFTLIQTASATKAEDEFRLGTFELRENLSLSEK